MRIRARLARLVIAAVATGCGPPARPPATPTAAPAAPVPPRPVDETPTPERGGDRTGRAPPPPIPITRQTIDLGRASAAPRAIDAWLTSLEADAERVCRCADLACANRVFTDGAGLGLPKGELTPDQHDRVRAAMQRLAACHADLQGRAAPK